jgi:hypothetical protein
MPASPPTRAWQRLREYFRPPPIDTAAALRTFLAERASLIAQKCAIDYCRGKTGLASYALFTEQPFLKALEVCRWETFVAALEDLLILVEGMLRPHVALEQHSRLHQALISMHEATLATLPAPAHRANGWDDASAPFVRRFQAACLRQPQRAVEIADYSARRLFDTLPIHISMRQLDEEVVHGAVRFRMVAVHQELQRRMIIETLAAELAC